MAQVLGARYGSGSSFCTLPQPLRKREVPRRRRQNEITGRVMPIEKPPTVLVNVAPEQPVHLIRQGDHSDVAELLIVGSTPIATPDEQVIRTNAERIRESAAPVLFYYAVSGLTRHADAFENCKRFCFSLQKGILPVRESLLQRGNRTYAEPKCQRRSGSSQRFGRTFFHSSQEPTVRNAFWTIQEAQSRSTFPTTTTRGTLRVQRTVNTGALTISSHVAH